ncbi:MAG: hypothetical protein KDJ15_01865 [Alphaproteobacteria bacterium]|nr:hypothetical protein [Alphaproteobacteria bacterium]
MTCRRFFLFALLIFFVSPSAGVAQEPLDGGVPSFRSTSLPLPRFVSLRSDKVYARTGPGLRYPIRWVYKRENLPVEIVQEFDTWRKIKDSDGDEGWVHTSMISGERTVFIEGETLLPLREGKGENFRMTARLEPGVTAFLDRCEGEWCRLHTDGYRGWAERKFLWGIYANEKFD